MEYNIVDFGADSHEESNTKAIQQAIEQAFKDGGGRVYVPAGVFKVSALFLKSNIELHLSSGATLSFSDNPQEYPVVQSRWEGVHRAVYASCIYAEDAENIAITGFGTLQGNGECWWNLFRNQQEKLPFPRPKLISFEGCNRVTISGVRLINSPSWTVHPILCENVTIENISILNPADSPNTDGINPESCKNVRISNCNIDVGDDCIAIKAGTEDTAARVACENITITNCTMVHGHGGVVIGSEMSGSVRNVTISNCVFQDTDRGIRLKSRRGRGGIIEDIRISNLVMDNVLCPFIINLYYFCGPRGKEKYVSEKKPYPIDERTPHVRRIHFMNITARNVQAAAGFIFGLAEWSVADITFNNIDISMAKEGIPSKPAMMAGIEAMHNHGFYIGFAKDLVFQRVSIENHEGPAFLLESTQQVEISDCRSYNTKAQEKLIQEQETRGV